MPPKTPAAMPLHVEDFLHGTERFTNEEVGAYVRLLLHEWEAGFVPGDDRVTLAALLHDSPRAAMRLWGRIGPKFTRDADGRWRNARLQRERAGAVDYSALQAARARSRWKAYR